MLNITPAMRRYAAEHFTCNDANLKNDDYLMNLFVKALDRGELTLREFAELVEPGEEPIDDEDDLNERVKEEVDRLIDEENAREKGASHMRDGGGLGPATKAIIAGARQTNGSGNGSHPRVKDCTERFDHTRTTGLHVKSGKPVHPEIFGGTPAETSSEFDNARVGAYLKWTAMRAGLNVGWTPNEKAVFNHLVEEEPWCGQVGQEWKTDIRGPHLRALLDDATSGGQYVNPAVFDERIISYPLLTGELLPYVEVVDVPRGSTIEGATITAPTVSWGAVEGTAESLFGTSGMIGNTSNGIHTVSVIVEVGRDHLSDSITSLGQLLTSLIGERLQESLDNQIANGDGLTEPEGIFEKSGTTSVSSASGTSGPVDIEDLEALAFGIGKQYRVPRAQCAFVMQDADYRRFRQIPVGAADARRILGLDHQAYRLLEWPARIQEDITAGTVGFCALRKYRLYRRQGMTIEWTTQGETLLRKNTALLVVRGRYGGFLTDANAMSVITDSAVVG